MKSARDLKSVGRFGTIGLEIVLSILLGLWVGTKLDEWLGTSPWMAVAWFGFGCAAAARAVHRSWREMQAAAKREEAEEGNPEPQFPDERSLAWKREKEEERERAKGRDDEEGREREVETGEERAKGEGPQSDVERRDG